MNFIGSKKTLFEVSTEIAMIPLHFIFVTAADLKDVTSVCLEQLLTNSWSYALLVT